MNKRMNVNSAIELPKIIPVYNVENYLQECIDSVISQSCLRLEIILINDGSTDSSRAIADQYAKKDNWIMMMNNCMLSFLSGEINLYDNHS